VSYTHTLCCARQEADDRNTYRLQAHIDPNAYHALELAEHRPNGSVIMRDPAPPVPTNDVYDYCGSTCPLTRCMSLSEASGGQCPKDAVIRLFTEDDPVDVCGGHFGVHRRGKELRVYDR
jgi:hypothetical protein